LPAASLELFALELQARQQRGGGVALSRLGGLKIFHVADGALHPLESLGVGALLKQFVGASRLSGGVDERIRSLSL
jgi:hypothetical protein